MFGSVDELRFRPVPRTSSCVGACTKVQQAETVRGGRHVFGLAVGESEQALQKSALPRAGAPSQVAAPVPPASATGAELLELHAAATRSSAPQKPNREGAEGAKEKGAEDDCFMASCHSRRSSPSALATRTVVLVLENMRNVTHLSGVS